ncbi:MAG: carbohydrate ABC transporter permease [Faecousia sp.]
MKSRNRQILQSRLEGAVFIGPALLAFLPIVAIPFIYSVVLSVMEWNGISDEINFIGLKNYIRILTTDTDFRNAFWFTIRMTAVTATVSNILGLTFAVLLTRKLRIREWGRTALLLPNIMSGVILGYIWQFIFTRAFPALGELLGWGIFQESWLGTPQTAFWGIAIVSIWQWTGYTMIIYVAGINSISADVQEAAMLDGATGLQKFFRVTLPLIMPSVTICLFWTIVHACTMFDLPFALTAGGPYRTSETIAMNIYTEAFTRNNYGLGSAKAMLFFVVVLVIAQLQVYFTSKQEVQA